MASVKKRQMMAIVKKIVFHGSLYGHLIHHSKPFAIVSNFSW